MSDFDTRYEGREFFDDLRARGEAFDRALRELVLVNRYLGGYAATINALGPYLLRRRPGPVRILDLGAGLADVAAVLVRWCARKGLELRVTAVEGNSHAAKRAREWLDQELESKLRRHVDIVEADVWTLPHTPAEYDVVMASLFLHHMPEGRVVELLRLMNGSALDGILINDLHRHVLAYHGIRILGRVLRSSQIFQHDAPMSVRRGFRREELMQAAKLAEIDGARVRWHWAFRWTLSTVG